MPYRFEDHPTVSVTSVHSLVAIARNGWSRSIGTPGRNQLERVVAITRCAQFTTYYNFVRIHKTLRVTPAMAAGVTEKLWDVSDIVKVLEDWEAAN